MALTRALLLGYWAVMSWVPVPGVGAGVWEKGKDLGSYVDRAVFGTAHLWSQSRTWDPEGLLSTVPAIATVLLGVFAGEWLRSRRSAGQKVSGLVAAGVAGDRARRALEPGVPHQQGALDQLLRRLHRRPGARRPRRLVYWIVDVKGYKRWGFPFLVFGVNAIAAYWLSGLYALITIRVHVGDVALKSWLYDTLWASWLSPVNASLAYALTFVALWMLIMWGFYRKGVFIKV